MTPTQLYMTFWTLGFVIAGIVGVFVLHARRVLTPAAAVALLVACLGVLIGSKWQFRLESLPLGEALVFPPGDLVSGGRRIDLGLVLGFALGALWCLTMRLPWRAVADALAVASSVLIPVGRIGCLLFGCCMGAPCGHGAPFCLRFPPGSEAYNQQLRDGLIPLSATFSLPAHPLPLYFAAASVLTLGVLLWLLRRDVTPGALFLTFCILRPAAKLALEPLRANPSPSPLMMTIPALVLAGAAIVVVGIALRWLTMRRLERAIVSALMATLLVTAAPVRAQDATVESALAPLPQEWIAVLREYAADPVRHRRSLRKLGRAGVDDLPPVVLLAMADARLRSGNRSAARRLFDDVVARDAGAPWSDWAQLGLGWVALLDDDLAQARTHFGTVARDGTTSRAMAMLVTALLDVELERSEEAVETLDRLSEDGEAAPPIRQAAALGSGYLRYWSEDFAQAAERFEGAAAIIPGSPLWDDARYGAAMARWHTGEQDRALGELRALGRMESLGAPDERRMRPVVDLERGALVRAGVVRYRRLPFRVPEEQVAALLDRDGPALSRAALRRLGEHVPPPLGGDERKARRRGPALVTTDTPRAVAVGVADSRPEPDPGWDRRWLTALLLPLAALAVIAGARVLRRAGGSKARRR